jgi:hypothetical protein
MKRYFRLITHLAFPADLISMVSGKPGDVVELDAERCNLFGRFLRLRSAAGDLVELDGPPSPPSSQPETPPAAAPPVPLETPQAMPAPALAPAAPNTSIAAATPKE